MARGRAGSERMFHKSSAARRAASVPVDLSGPSIATYVRAQDISSAAMDDTDALKARSRRQDQRLLDNITSTLTSGIFNQPATVMRSNSLLDYEPHRRASVASRQRYAHKRHAHEDEGFNYDLALPETSRAFRAAKLRARGMRASSVPPIPTYARTEIPETRSYVYSAGLPSTRGRPKERGRVYGGIAIDSPLFVQVSTAGSQPMRALRHEAPNFVGRSYQLKPPKRPAYSAWRAGSEPPPTPSTLHLGAHRRPMGLDRNTSLAMRQARQCLGRIERELGVEDNGPSYGRGYIDTSYAIEAPMAAPIIVPTRVTRAGSSRTAPPPRRYSLSGPPSSVSSNYYSSRSTAPPSSRVADIEARLESQVIPDDYLVKPHTSYTQLRSKATEARNKMDRHKVMLDRYLPIHWGPENEVQYEVDYKFGELADRAGRTARWYQTPGSAAGRSFARPRATPATMTSGRRYPGIASGTTERSETSSYYRRHSNITKPLLAISYY